MKPNFFNLSARKKRDLLFELLLGKSTEGIVSKKELIAVNRLIEGLSSNNATITIKKRPVIRTSTALDGMKQAKPKKKTTCYPAQEISEKSDKVQMAVRRLAPPDLRSRVFRSYIVNQALAVTWQDFSAKGKDSSLMRSIMQKI